MGLESILQVMEGKNKKPKKPPHSREGKSRKANERGGPNKDMPCTHLVRTCHVLHPDTHNCGGLLPLADDIKAPAEAERGSSTLLGTAALTPSTAGSGIQTQAESTHSLAAGTPSHED